MPATVRARHILFKHVNVKNPVSKGANPGPVTRTEEEALKQISEILNLVLKDPSKFAEIAKKVSDCNSFKGGGDLGKFKREAMHKEVCCAFVKCGELTTHDVNKKSKQFSDAAFALQVNEVSGVVASPSGLHIIMRYE